MLNLEGITAKGKQRIKAHGTSWKILKESKVAFSNDIHYKIESMKTKNLRWIKISQDKDFNIIK